MAALGESLGVCLRVTERLLMRPLNKFFSDPVDVNSPDLPGYAEKVMRPMDLSTVKTNLEKRAYKTSNEWYRDVCLIYENAIRYHSEDSPWGVIAAQLLKEFKREASGLGAETFAEWSSVLAAETMKLGLKISGCPIRHGRNDLVRECVDCGKIRGKFNQDMVPELVETLKVICSRDEARAGVIALIERSEKLKEPMAMDDGELVVDVAKLSDTTLHALNLYGAALR